MSHMNESCRLSGIQPQDTPSRMATVHGGGSHSLRRSRARGAAAGKDFSIFRFVYSKILVISCRKWCI